MENLRNIDFYGVSLERIQQKLSCIQLQRIVDLGQYPRHAAVLIVLLFENNIPSILFMKRSEGVKSHKGQVSFPGGMCEAKDASNIATALREFEEEVGLSKERLYVLGEFHQVLAVSNVPVHSVVAFLDIDDPIDDFPFDKREVDSLFVVSLVDLLDPQYRKTESLGMRNNAPVFNAGLYPIWGLTAYLLNRFLEEIFDFPSLNFHT